jgi:hypothetical protein
VAVDVHIADVVSTVRTIDGEALLSPRVMEEIVRAVLHVVEEREAHQARVRQEQRIVGCDCDGMAGGQV